MYMWLGRKKKQELLNANRGPEEAKHISELRTGTHYQQEEARRESKEVNK